MTPPDKQPAAETLEEIAHKITAPFFEGSQLPTRFAAYSAILSALRNLGERCAVIAETCHPQPCTCQTCLIRAEAGAAIRRTIREGK